jgi:hypothetical protein
LGPIIALQCAGVNAGIASLMSRAALRKQELYK